MVEKKSCGLPGFFFTAEYKELGAELRGGRRYINLFDQTLC